MLRAIGQQIQVDEAALMLAALVHADAGESHVHGVRQDGVGARSADQDIAGHAGGMRPLPAGAADVVVVIRAPVAAGDDQREAATVSEVLEAVYEGR